MVRTEIPLLDSEELAEGVRAFRFAKPSGFDFLPGQFANFTLLDPSEVDEAGTRRSFTIASAPHEHELMIATLMRPSAFKRSLVAMPVGAHVAIEGPYGELVYSDDGRPAVFVAASIGITPFLSILRDAAHRGSARRITLVYGNRTPQAAAFLGELELLGQRLPRLRVVNVMSEPEKAQRAWTGETGLLDAKLLARVVPDLVAPTWYVVGPTAMTAALRDTLASLGVADSAVRVEGFTGY